MKTPLSTKNSKKKVVGTLFFTDGEKSFLQKIERHLVAAPASRIPIFSFWKKPRKSSRFPLQAFIMSGKQLFCYV